MGQLPSDLVMAYTSLFVHCWDAYAVQQQNGSYWRVEEPLTLPLLGAHLTGRWTLGTYLLDRDSCCSFAVFDADSMDGVGQLIDLADELRGHGIPALLEASRRGGHLWLHFTESTPAWKVRAWLLPYAQALGVELYPKQDMLAPGGSGSLIRLPLGMHRKSRGWYPFLARSVCGEWGAVGETVEECCAWLVQHVERTVVPDVAVCNADVSAETSVPAPMASHASVEGRYESIRAWCQAQDIVGVIGRYVTLDRRGVGSCPFKDHHHRGDRRPSFQVFGGSDPHWYCYTWRRAGDLFDFLCLYHQVTPQEAWERLRTGGLL